MIPSNIVESYCNKQGTVKKMIHANGAENCLKISSGCTSTEEKNKAVLFLSVSVGCQQKCSFCYLTAKCIPFESLSEREIFKMGAKCLFDSRDILKDRYLKISFMGMGDVFATRIDYTSLAIDLLVYAARQGLILGFDGIDVGTSFPKYGLQMFRDFSTYLVPDTKFNISRAAFNPANSYSELTDIKNNYRTFCRLFISLHSPNQNIRRTLMPRSMHIKNISILLKNFKYDVIFHMLFFDGINDSDQDIKDLIEFSKQHRNREFRLLRFNKCKLSPDSLKESSRIDEIIQELKNSDLLFKYQISTGSEIQAACGQFRGTL